MRHFYIVIFLVFIPYTIAIHPCSRIETNRRPSILLKNYSGTKLSDHPAVFTLPGKPPKRRYIFGHFRHEIEADLSSSDDSIEILLNSAIEIIKKYERNQHQALYAAVLRIIQSATKQAANFLAIQNILTSQDETNSILLLNEEQFNNQTFDSKIPHKKFPLLILLHNATTKTWLGIIFLNKNSCTVLGAEPYSGSNPLIQKIYDFIDDQA